MVIQLYIFQKRWNPFDLPKESERVDFVQGMKTVAGAGDPKLRNGMAIHVYSCNADMINTSMTLI